MLEGLCVRGFRWGIGLLGIVMGICGLLMEFLGSWRGNCRNKRGLELNLGRV